MQQILVDFYENLEALKDNICKQDTRTISTSEFKRTIKDIFSEWKTSIRPSVDQTTIFDKSKIDQIDLIMNQLYSESTKRVAKRDTIQSLLTEAHDIFFRHITIPLKTAKNLHIVTLKREDLIKRLNLTTNHFPVAIDYFEEAKSCFKFGFFRAATIIAISALESCLKIDYLRIHGSEFSGRLFTLLNRYFSGDIKRLPKQYEDFSKTHIKIRNSITHPEEFDYSEPIVFNVLTTVMELIKSIEALYR